ncbi:hypothetical protein PWT90_11072 [Aphanocladium album]|nr:hypothetical protein PWT90_11072 [Aphanocladium album]
MIKGSVQNHSGSRLLRLPDGLLAKIMSHMVLEDLLRLRYTSRTFMRIFSNDAQFRCHHLTAEQDARRFRDTVRIWAAPAAFYPGQQQYSKYLLCDECAMRRNGDLLGKAMLRNMPSLYCSGCRTVHREMHFSQLQREHSCDSTRVCLGHEGCTRICVHQFLSLSQVSARAASNGHQSFVCKYRHGKSLPACAAATCPADNRPRTQCYHDEEGKLRVRFEAAWHVEAKRMPNGKISAMTLRNSLNRFYADSDLGRWSGVFSPRVGYELRAFDPNLCDCIDWYDGRFWLAKCHALKTCPLGSAARCRQEAREGQYVSTTGRCAHARHGFTDDFAQVSIDVLKCHEPRNGMLVMRQTVDCAVDLTLANSSGWGDLISPASVDTFCDVKQRGLNSCSDHRCAVSWLEANDLHLRSIERKQMLREQRRRAGIRVTGC